MTEPANEPPFITVHVDPVAVARALAAWFDDEEGCAAAAAWLADVIVALAAVSP